jgi:cytochrome P450
MASNIHFIFSGLIVATFLGVQHFFPHLLIGFQLSHDIFFLVIANILLYLFWNTWFYPTFVDPLKHLPEPQGGLPFIRFGGEQLKRPPSLKVLKWINTIPNDGLLRIPSFLGRYRLIPTNPKILRELLVTKSYDFEKPEAGRDILRLVLGEGLVVVEGDLHKFQRKNLNPMFNFRYIKELYPLMWGKALEMTRRVKIETESNDYTDTKNSIVVEANQWASRATLDIIGVAALGRDFDTLRRTDDELVQVYEWLFQPTRELQLWFIANILFSRYLTKWIPWKVEKEVTSRSVRLREICRELVRNKRDAMRTEAVQSVDILAHLIRSNNFSDDELVDQVLTFLAAGLVLLCLAKYQLS